MHCNGCCFSYFSGGYTSVSDALYEFNTLQCAQHIHIKTFHPMILSVSGFVAQGSPDLILKSLAERYEQECKDGIKNGVGNLTLLFGGGPGDWDR